LTAHFSFTVEIDQGVKKMSIGGRSVALALAVVLLILVSLDAGVSQEKRVTIRVVVPPSTPKEASIFIAGNAPELADWNPGKVRMHREGDSVWSFSGSAPSGAFVEFKITRGSWNTQALYEDGVIPPNISFVVTGDTTIIVRPLYWRDLSPAFLTNVPGGGIVGTVKYHRGLKGEGLQHERDVIVWLPPSYENDAGKRYPVLYMHDGQNVFDPNTSFIGYDWHADEVADSLIKAGKMQEVIIVGIYNTPDRISEYSNSEIGRNYARFVVQRLKPLIDSTYRTEPGQEHTAVMGSSMGGTISFLFAWWYPEIFSQAGCISTAIAPVEDRRLLDAIRDYDGAKKRIRFYLDVGELEPGLIPGYEALVSVLQEKGYEKGKDLEFVFDRGAAHNEHAWANRLWRPLTFMFGIR
jgi:predicted alpha/beta superfamily hydrolase